MHNNHSIAPDQNGDELACMGPPPPLQLTVTRVEKPTIEAFENLELSEIEVERKLVEIKGASVRCNMVVAIRDYPAEKISMSLLRKICSVFKVSGYKHANKTQTLALIAQHKTNKDAYDAMYVGGEADESGNKAPRKEPQCPFRLMNILFSADFRERLLELSGNRSREQLNGRVSVENLFWQDVRKAFVLEENEEAGKLQFPTALYIEHDIDPSRIILHNCKKLKTIYADLRARYKVARAKFIQSGTHDSEFWNFCSGQLDLLYLHEYVSAYPGTDISVTSMMPSHLQLSSSDGGSLEPYSVPRSPSLKRKREKANAQKHSKCDCGEVERNHNNS